LKRIHKLKSWLIKSLIGLELSILKSKSHLYKRIEELELELDTQKKLANIMQYQLDKAMHDIWAKDSRIKEMENGRPNKDK